MFCELCLSLFLLIGYVVHQHEMEEFCLKRDNIAFLSQLVVYDAQCGCAVHLTCGALGDKEVVVML